MSDCLSLAWVDQASPNEKRDYSGLYLSQFAIIRVDLVCPGHRRNTPKRHHFDGMLLFTRGFGRLVWNSRGT